MDRLQLDLKFTVDDAGQIEGRGAVFDSVDLGGDLIRKGAFAGVQPPLPMLDSHRADAPVGVWTHIEERADGLHVKGRLLVGEVARADEIRALIKSGAMTGLSIGYKARKARAVNGGRELSRIDLFEISVVAVPMHPGARVTALKGVTEGSGMDQEEMEKLRGAVTALEQKTGGDAIRSAVEAVVSPFVQRLDKIEAKNNRGGGGSGGGDDVTPERKAFQSYLQRGDLAGDAELKTLTLSNDASGGYLAPPEFSSEVLRDLVEFSPLRSVASSRGTGAGSVIYPTRAPMGNAKWKGELEETEETTGQPFGSTQIEVHELTTYVDISNILLQDAPEVEAEVRSALVEDFALKEGAAFMSGEGKDRPQGLMRDDRIEHMTGPAVATSAMSDALIRFLYSIPQTYRRVGTWAMNGNTLALIRTLKDGQGNYLWQPAFQAGQPETVLGRPVVEMLDMPDALGDDAAPLAGNEPIIYGDFSAYRILDRLSMSMLVDPYTRAKQRQTRFHATRRVGGAVLQPAKFKKYRIGGA